jgi:uncharacterized membrane protein
VHTRAKVLGQPVNPVLMLLPLGLLAPATLADVGAVLSGLSLFGAYARADMIPGLLLGGVALCALLVDLLTAPAGSTARAVLSVVCLAFGGMLGLFTLVWTVEGSGSHNGGLVFIELLALACGIVAVSLARALVTGRGLPHSLTAEAVEPPPALSFTTAPALPPRFNSAAATKDAIARRWLPAANSDDPEATVAIYGYATGKAQVRPKQTASV